MRVLLVDDNEITRDSLQRAIVSRGVEVSHAVGDAATLLSVLPSTLHVDAAIIDLKLPPTYSDDGIRLATELRKQRPMLGIIIVSAYEEQLRLTYAERALSNLRGRGGIGYLFKDRVTRDSLRDAITRVAAGGVAVDPEFAAEAARRAQAEDATSGFTSQEIAILEGVAQGMTNAELAEITHMSVATVERYLKRVFDKLHPTTTQHAEDANDKNKRVLLVLGWLRTTGRLDA